MSVIRPSEPHCPSHRDILQRREMLGRQATELAEIDKPTYTGEGDARDSYREFERPWRELVRRTVIQFTSALASDVVTAVSARFKATGAIIPSIF